MQSLAFIVLALVFTMSHGSQVEQDLLEKILNKDKYDTRIRPSTDPNEAVPITVDIYLLKLRNIDEVKGEADVGLWISMAWNDSRLAWKPSDYKDLKKIVIASKNIWVPDQVLYTGSGVVEQVMSASEKFTATVKSTGEVYYVVPAIRTLPCIHKTDDDGLVCSFSVGSWTLQTDDMTVTTTGTELDTTLLGTYVDPSYKIKKTLYKVEHKTYPDAPEEKYDMVKVKILLDGKK